MNADHADALLAFIEGNWSKKLTEDEAGAWVLRLCSQTVSFELGRAVLESFVHRPADAYNSMRRPTPIDFVQRLRAEQNRDVQLQARKMLAAAPDPNPSLAPLMAGRLLDEHNLRGRKTPIERRP